MELLKRVFPLFGALLLLAGCRSPRLQEGRYLGRDRGEFAMVYRDLIFLRVRAARNIPGSLAFWEWGGKYSVDPETGRITLVGMERENARLWNFCYGIYSERGAVVLRDLTENKRFVLSYETPAQARPAGTPAPYGSAGVDPVYQPLAPIN
ncbi:MAG: hypothetical protein IJT50_12620 [Lentisphaeria bacterium]|nr:hypothetical protein [Lentisphaeria bacterium]